MGLSNFPSPSEGLLPLLVINAVMSLVLVKNLLRSVLVRAAGNQDYELGSAPAARRVSTTSYWCIRGGDGIECSVCLCKFKADEQVSELSCQHFFHKACLDKWFDNQRISCPLCRSIN